MRSQIFSKKFACLRGWKGWNLHREGSVLDDLKSNGQLAIQFELGTTWQVRWKDSFGNLSQVPPVRNIRTVNSGAALWIFRIFFYKSLLCFFFKKILLEISDILGEETSAFLPTSWNFTLMEIPSPRRRLGYQAKYRGHGSTKPWKS